MNDKILFIVINGEIKFLQNSTMDHREWYLSLGGNIENYTNVIRGYIIKDMIIFFKDNLNYDNEVIEFASKMGLTMKEQLHRPDLKICCGINPGQNGERWEPILVLKDEDLQGYKTEEQIQKEAAIAKRKEEFEAMKDTTQGPIIEFKNNLEDAKFRRAAIIFTIIMLIVVFISKLSMIQDKTMMMSNRWNFFLFISQIGTFLITILLYIKKSSKAKFFAIAASAISVLIFNIVDIIVAIINLFFTADSSIILGIVDALKSVLLKLFKKETNNGQ